LAVILHPRLCVRQIRVTRRRGGTLAASRLVWTTKSWPPVATMVMSRLRSGIRPINSDMPPGSSGP
jgi:hypothetical protein